MKLTLFNTKTCKSTTGKQSIAQVSIKNTGSFSFTGKLLESINLNSHSKVAFAKDEETGDWYLFASEDGFALSPKKNFGTGGVFCRRAIACQISTEEGKSKVFTLGEPVKQGEVTLFPLIAQ